MKINVYGTPFELNENQAAWVEQTLSSMNLEEKIGQLFCVMGDNYDSEQLHSLVKEQCIGGVLFRPGPQKEVKEKYAVLDEFARIPLLKAANLEEGGTVPMEEYMKN